MTNPFLNPDGHVDKYRHRLPHWQQGEAWQFVTWRLADSLPAEKLEALREEKAAWLSANPGPRGPEMEQEYHRLFTDRIEHWLDAGNGSCALRNQDAAAIVEGAIRFFDGERYALGPFVIMPNHVHILFQPMESWTVEDILHSWKSYTAKKINGLRGTTGAFWQREYWDRIVRSEEQWHVYRSYIEQNPQGLKPGTFVTGVGTKKSPL